jgi:hypothetical protein
MDVRILWRQPNLCASRAEQETAKQPPIGNSNTMQPCCQSHSLSNVQCAFCYVGDQLRHACCCPGAGNNGQQQPACWARGDGARQVPIPLCSKHAVGPCLWPGDVLPHEAGQVQLCTTGKQQQLCPILHVMREPEAGFRAVARMANTKSAGGLVVFPGSDVCLEVLARCKVLRCMAAMPCTASSL